MLKENESYISGQQLCDRFGVSRTAIWKVIEQLKKEGYEIEAVRNKGYRLNSSPDVISEAEISSHLKTEWAGKKIVCYEQTDSTNNRAKDAGEQGAEHGALFIAEHQTAGKGRRGRTWVSPSGNSIYMTLLLRPHIHPNQAPMLTLVMGLSVAEAISQTTNEKAEIKWPNDIVVNKKKICGILTEMSLEMHDINYVVVGVGINVNQREYPDEVKETATSLYMESGHRYKRSVIIAEVLKQFEKNYEMFMQTGDLSGLKEQYNACLINRGKMVKVLDPNGEYEAEAEGISENGELIVALPDGEKRHIFAGEVSVRGIYGYV